MNKNVLKTNYVIIYCKGLCADTVLIYDAGIVAFGDQNISYSGCL